MRFYAELFARLLDQDNDAVGVLNAMLEHENEVLRRAAAYLSQANLPGK